MLKKLLQKRISVKGLLALMILCVVLFLLGTATYAVFTSSLHAQRTIAAYDSSGDRFSSNALLKGNSRDNVRTVYTTNVAVPASTVVTVCNYQQGNRSLPFDEDFSYTLTARLVRYDAEEVDKYVPVDAAYLSGNSLTGYTVAIGDDDSTAVLGNTTLSHTFNGLFTGGADHSFVYTVSFSAGFAEYKPNLYLELVAEPSNAKLPTIRGVLKPDLRAAGATDLWMGSFRDDSGTLPYLYNGYNYVVTGSGTGTATISWDGTKVVLSDVSRDLLLSVTGASQDGDSITFPVDSDLESRYDLQFYNKNITTSETTWQIMSSSVVTFNFS